MFPRRLRSLLSTNDSLSDDQTRMVTARQRQLSEEQIKLDRELNGSTSISEFRRSAVEAKLKTIYQELQSCSILLAPIRRLPIDLLIEIFLHCPSAYPNSQRRNQVILGICSVSSLWRNVALNTPGFWTSLCLTLPNVDEEDPNYNHAFQQASNWIQRSGDHLSLSLRLDVRDKSDADGCTHAVLKFITPFMWRIRHLDLGTCFAPDILFSIFAVSTFKNTQSLTIRSQAHGGEYNRFIRSGSSIWPSLRRVVLERALLSSSISRFPLPWNQLTHLTVEYLYDHLWIDLLSQCPQLICGSFHCLGQTLIHCDPPDLPPIQLLYLEDLTLTFAQAVNPGVLFRLELPALVTLRLGSSAPDNMDLWGDNADDFFLQIATIRHLALVKEWPINIDLFKLLLQHTPYLMTLELCVDTDFKAIFQTLGQSEAEIFSDSGAISCFVPGLTTIMIDVVFYYAYGQQTLGSFPSLALANFLRSRSKPESRTMAIQSCIIYVSDDVREERRRKRIWRLLEHIDPENLSARLNVCPRMTCRGWRDRLPNFMSGLDYN